MLVQEQRIRARAYELWELAGQTPEWEDEFSYQTGKDRNDGTRRYPARPAANPLAGVENGTAPQLSQLVMRTSPGQRSRVSCSLSPKSR
jgi:hypothetical protein